MLTLAVINAEIEKIIANGNCRADVALLADLLICRSELSESPAISAPQTITGSSCLDGKCISDILPAIDELIEATKALNPRLYECFMQKIE